MEQRLESLADFDGLDPLAALSETGSAPTPTRLAKADVILSREKLRHFQRISSVIKPVRS